MEQKDSPPVKSNDIGFEISTTTYSVDEHILTSNVLDVESVAKSQLKFLGTYYNLTQNQSQNSFWSALVVAIIGFILFGVAILFLILTGRQDVSIASIVSGTLVEVISAINFYLYRQTTVQLAQAKQSLDRTQRFLLANNICERLDDERKHSVRSQLIMLLVSREKEIEINNP